MFSSLHRMLARIRAVFESSDFDRDLQLELESHIQLLTEEHIRKGTSQEEARRLARIEFRVRACGRGSPRDWSALRNSRLPAWAGRDCGGPGSLS